MLLIVFPPMWMICIDVFFFFSVHEIKHIDLKVAVYIWFLWLGDWWYHVDWLIKCDIGRDWKIITLYYVDAVKSQYVLIWRCGQWICCWLAFPFDIVKKSKVKSTCGIEWQTVLSSFPVQISANDLGNLWLLHQRHGETKHHLMSFYLKSCFFWNSTLTLGGS